MVRSISATSASPTALRLDEQLAQGGHDRLLRCGQDFGHRLHSTGSPHEVEAKGRVAGQLVDGGPHGVLESFHGRTLADLGLVHLGGDSFQLLLHEERGEVVLS